MKNRSNPTRYLTQIIFIIPVDFLNLITIFSGVSQPSFRSQLPNIFSKPYVLLQIGFELLILLSAVSKRFNMLAILRILFVEGAHDLWDSNFTYSVISKGITRVDAC